MEFAQWENMSNTDWNTLNKQEKSTLLKSAGLPIGLSQLSWAGLQKSERKKLEATKSKGKGWHEEKKEVRTEKGIEKKAPIHREVAIKKEACEANNTPMQKPVHEERKELPKEWKKPDMPHEWYEAYKLKYDPHLSHEAQTYFYEKKIAVGKKFFELPDEKVKKLTIAHEVGHIFEELTRELQLSLAGGQASKILGTMKGDYYDGFMGGYRPSEAYANAVAETYSRPEWVEKNHPEIYTLIIETVPADWKAAIEHFMSESEAGVESEHRLDKSQGDGEFIATLINPPYQVLKIDGSNIQYTSPHHEGHIMFQGREHAEGIQKALEDVTEVIQTTQTVLEKAPHTRAYYKFKLTDLKKDINFNKPHLNLVFGLRPVKEYFGRGSATIGARGIKFWWFKPEDSSKHFEENPYYSIEATPPATIAHEIAHTLGSDNEFIDPLATLVAFMFYTKHHEYMAENSFEYMSHEIGRTTNEIVMGKLKRPAVTSEMLRYYYAENPVELAAVVGQYSREDSDKIWAFLAQEKKKAEKPKEKKVFQFTPTSYIEYAKQYPWGIYKISMIAGTKSVAPEQNLAYINQWMAHHNYDENLIKEWNKEVKAEKRYTALQILDELGIPFGLSDPAYKTFDPRHEEAEDWRMKDEEERENRPPHFDLIDVIDTGKTEQMKQDIPDPVWMEAWKETELYKDEFNELVTEAMLSGATAEDYDAWKAKFGADVEGTIETLKNLNSRQKKWGNTSELVRMEKIREPCKGYFIFSTKQEKPECIPIKKYYPFKYEGIELFAHKNEDGSWNVYEKSTGQMIIGTGVNSKYGRGKDKIIPNDKESVIQATKQKIKDLTPNETRRLISEAREREFIMLSKWG